MSMPKTPHDLLGHYVTDVVGNCDGIAIAYSEHLYGCNHVLIEPTTLLESGKLDTSFSIDEQRVEYAKPGPNTEKAKRASIPLGSRVRHKVNGFEGIAVVRSSWINHKPTVDIEPIKRGKDGQILEVMRFDEDMVEILAVGEPRYSKTFMGYAGKKSGKTSEKGTGSSRVLSSGPLPTAINR